MLNDDDQKRFDALKDRFESVVKKRRKWDLETRRSVVDRLLTDFAQFAGGLIDRHGPDALPAVFKLASYLEDEAEGALLMIEKALNPRPPEFRVPLIPAERLKRSCKGQANTIRNRALFCAMYE